jgi:hypothetical protein
MTLHRAWFRCLVLSALAMLALNARAQDVTAGRDSHKIQSTHMVKADQVRTDDPIALLAIRREPVIAADVAPVKLTGGTPLLADEAACKAAEIPCLEQRIRDKQKRVGLLMRLFVQDERAFLNDPGNSNVDAVAAERRRYEQDELRSETADLARMKTRLREITAAR